MNKKTIRTVFVTAVTAITCLLSSVSAVYAEVPKTDSNVVNHTINYLALVNKLHKHKHKNDNPDIQSGTGFFNRTPAVFYRCFGIVVILF